MKKFEWDDSFSVGVPQFDDDHKQLIAIINRVAEASETHQGVAWALDDLTDYTETHFAREEKRLSEHNYPKLEAHHQEHQKFIDWLKLVKKTYRLSSEAESAVADTVNAYLCDWLTAHILKSDMQYKGLI